jgi:glycosyl transferase family 25
MSENIEKIIYINLKQRVDRRVEIETELEKMGLSGKAGKAEKAEKAERFEAIQHTSGTVGCGQSHLAVLKLARDRGYKNILILEDDFQFLVSKEELEAKLQLFFNSQIPYDVCMLSYNLYKSEKVPAHPFLLKVNEAHTTSGYIVNQSCYTKLIHLYEYAIPKLESTGMHWVYSNDVAWVSLQQVDPWYCFSPRLGKQRAGWSDIGQAFQDYGV